MRRARTTTMLLISAAGVAVTAVSGCVSVSPDRPLAQGQSPGASAPGRDTPDVRSQIVQAPVREALEIAQPPSPTPTAPRPAAQSAPEPGPGQQHVAPRPPARDRAPETHHRVRPHEAGGAGAGRHDRPQERGGPRADRPAPGAAPVGAAGVCELGETYGHWPAGSPQARICHETYRH
ncbi:hypothetical protein [Streptomyces sp. NBC_01497]|uniref:hypothetical protein n=1 Tax=Streptomyces sp. NBC_01497 TaxID=2903885 RepID=UPI002E33577F|nr:hypothetical protein [Streptomyces sp. NBC_01497]